MKKLYPSANRPALFVLAASVQTSLAACSSSQLSPPPPFVPYEINRGDAAAIGRAVGNIQASSHSTAPQFTQIFVYPPSPGTVVHTASLTIKNRTDCKLGFYLDGPSPRQLGVPGRRSETVYVSEGSYAYAIDTRLCAGNVFPLYRGDVFSAGHAYSFSISLSDVEKGADLTVHNETGAAMQLSFQNTSAGTQRNVGTVNQRLEVGSTTIRLLEGTYNLAARSRCGERTRTLQLAPDRRYEYKIWCETHQINVDESRSWR